MKILVVDDEKDIQPLFEQRFRKEIRSGEMEFAFAFSGEEAMQFLEKNLHEAVLILSDINMPGMSGLELLSRIKARHREPPPTVMMISAYGDQENYKKAMELGADDFISKPVDFVVLKEKIKKIV
ncbi:MAG: response regulator [Bacteroidetes bacterium HGW-Bacteroidetes-9]|nr:MAG: response regulator [Bacteroidetes bacterium HGW-Bacteroidetes-9]